MWWRRRDVTIVIRCAEATFSIMGEDKAECIERKGMFKYLGQVMGRLDDECPSVLRNTRKARQVWDSLGEILGK